MATSKTLAAMHVESKIHEIRGERVMLDADLADVYGVTTRALNQAVKRNEERFPQDFAFQLTPQEIANLKSQSVTSSSGHGGRRKPPWVFSEHGTIMVASVLNSPRAIEMSVFVVRAFVRLREYARGHVEIAKRLDALERTVTGHDEDLLEMFTALRALLMPSPRSSREIGFAKKGSR
jgi:hypothetical protein